MLCQLHRNVKAPYCPICLQERLAEQKMELEQWRAENQDTENPQVRPMTKTENLLMDAMRCIAELKAEIRRLREYYDAHQAIEHGIIDFDLHRDAVERLRKAQQAIEENK